MIGPLGRLRAVTSWPGVPACAGLASPGRDLWTPDDTLPPEQKAFELHLARRICASCPVRVDCLADELSHLDEAEPHSMRGGLTPDEIVAFARDLGYESRRRAQHGTRSKYVAGCRCRDCRDAHKVYEHERRLWAKSRGRSARVTHAELDAWLAKPRGRGRWRAEAGQLLLFTDGLPRRYVAHVDGETA